MKELRKKVVDSEVVVKVTCNKCGKVAVVNERDSLDESFFEVCQAWGYGSNHDGEVHSWDLCESCYDTLVQTFVSPIATKRYL